LYKQNIEQLDTDSDDIGDACDNCPNIINLNQTDDDYDTYGAECDCDDNNSLINPGIAEVCDNLDNDCNSEIDDNLSQQTPNQQGLCFENTQTCIEGIWVPGEENYQTEDETCDNLDNDCDGLVDEDLNRLSENQFGLCNNNSQTCLEGVWLEDETNYIAIEELCDNRDNDCDNQTDENLTQLLQNQIGLCEGNFETCYEAQWVPDIENYIEENETQDSQDNDCDGSTDEGFVVGELSDYQTDLNESIMYEGITNITISDSSNKICLELVGDNYYRESRSKNRLNNCARNLTAIWYDKNSLSGH